MEKLVDHHVMVHCGDNGNVKSDHNDDNLVEHDLPSRRMEIDRKNNPSQLPIKWHNFPATEDKSVMMISKAMNWRANMKLDPVGSAVRYEMMKLCTGSVKDTMRW